MQMTGTEPINDGIISGVGFLNETLNNNNSNETALGADTSYQHSFETAIAVERFCMPIICISGLICNTLSTITFMRKPLRHAPCSLYLAMRGICDNGFLIGLLLVWISSTFNLRLSQVKGVCQLTIFMTYVCGCLSVWLCVFITFENYLRIQRPYVARRKGPLVSKLSIAILLLCTVCIYSTSMWILADDCSHNPAYSSLTQFLVYSDTLLTLVIPTILIFVLLSLITIRMIRIVHVRNVHERLVEKLTKGAGMKRPVLPIAKVTKMLFVVSVTYFILNFPSHVIRLLLMVGHFTKGHVTAPFVQAMVQLSFQLIYYLSFSINFIIYIILGSNFRRVFKKTFCKCLKVHRAPYVQTEAINEVRDSRHSTKIYGVDKCTSREVRNSGI